jgi:ABC-type bacteriocin/lantibiotic exporter with double-glycine peptidase domain
MSNYQFDGPHPLRRFFKMLATDRRDIIYVYVYAILNGVVNLSLPLGIQAIIGLILAGQVSSSWVILTAVVTLGVALAGVLQVIQLSITEILQQRIFTRASFEFAYRIPRFNTESVSQYYPPELINRFFDTLNVQKGLSKILMDFSTSALQIVFGLILLSFYHPFFIFFGLVLIGLLVFIFYYTGPRGLESSLYESKYKYRVAHWLKELARTMSTFKLAGHTDLPMQKTDSLVKNYLKYRKDHFKVLVFQYANIVGFKSLITLGLLVLGGILVINNEINVGQFVASEIVIILIMNSAEKLILTMEPIYDVLTAVEKIANVTDIPLEDEKGQVKYAEVDTGKGMAIELREVNYKSLKDKSAVLQDINLNIKANESICFSGPNGCGKTTLLSIITGLYDLYEGTVIVNDYPVGNINEPDLRYYIGDSLVQEDIFEGSLYENITIGREGIDRERVKWAAKNLFLEEFAQSLPQGYDTMLESAGGYLSSGIIKKIILARSVVCHPRLIVMDDFMQVFVKEERDSITDFLTDKSNNWTLLVISSDPYMVSKCDRHVFMDKGKIERIEKV